MSKGRRITVIGAGLMGNGIAQVCATNGHQVTLNDVSDDALASALANIERSLTRLQAKGALGEDSVVEVIDRIETTTDLDNAAARAEVVIEAVVEDIDVKRQIFARLDSQAPSEAILASNTSNFSITAIATATSRPQQVIGMHWFNPPPVMKLVEIVRGALTSDETLEGIVDLSAQLGKTTVVAKDCQGFITTRLATAMVLEAFRMFDEGIGSRDDIDAAVRLGLNHPMGPFELIDLTGLDTTLSVAEAMTEAFGDRFRAPSGLRTMVNAGRTGRKAGAGMYDYRG